MNLSSRISGSQSISPLPGSTPGTHSINNYSVLNNSSGVVTQHHSRGGNVIGLSSSFAPFSHGPNAIGAHDLPRPSISEGISVVLSKSPEIPRKSSNASQHPKLKALASKGMTSAKKLHSSGHHQEGSMSPGVRPFRQTSTEDIHKFLRVSSTEAQNPQAAHGVGNRV